MTIQFKNAVLKDKKTAHEVIPESAKQQRRLVDFLISNQGASTVDVNQHCAIGNIAHIAIQCNTRLYPVGMYVHCIKPATPFPNRFKEPSNMFEWYLSKLPKELLVEHNKKHGLQNPDRERAA